MKLIISHFVGGRDGDCAAWGFIQDVADRVATRIQFTSNGHKTYLDAVEGAFGAMPAVHNAVSAEGTIFHCVS